MLSRPLRLLVLLAGIIAGQFLLYGPSLIGSKILLPLDILTGPGVYIPLAQTNASPHIENIYLSDLVYVFEPARRFATDEIHAGRFPLWAPYQYAGVPFTTPKFSPYFLLQCVTRSPVILAWAQLALALVAGLGAYAFCRRALGVSYWPAAVIGWSYPLTGFFVFWQGYPTAWPVSWLPWLLLAVWQMVALPNRFSALIVSLLTCLALISGSLDVALQVLLASALFAWWCVHEQALANSDADIAHISRRWVLKMAGKLALAWFLGFLLAAPSFLTLIEYSRTGARLARRSAGQEERPPVGLSALPQVVLPDMYGEFGAMKTGSFRYVGDSQQESTAAAYAGFVAILFLAPLAFTDRRRLPLAIFCSAACFLGLAWALGVPGVIQVMRWPVLNMLSHNRFVFLTAFAFLALAAIGLQAIHERAVSWHKWMWIPALLVAGLGLFCIYRAVVLPEPIASQLALILKAGKRSGWIRDAAALHQVQSAFTAYYVRGAALSGLGLVAWIILRWRPALLSRLFPALALLLPLDLLWNGHGRSVQADPALYYPPVPVLAELARTNPNRVIGYDCLPANLASMSGLDDVRGYDAVDPADMVALLQFCGVPGRPIFSYALTQWLAPIHRFDPAGQIRLPPILDMLGVERVIFRGSPPAGAKVFLQSPDYWVAKNDSALSRVFIPHSVQAIPDLAARLSSMAAPAWDPRLVAFTDRPLNLPRLCQGTASISKSSPTRIQIEANMTTPGLLVLADRWDSGWHAVVDGKRAPILRVNQVVRGVVLPVGKHAVEFVYRPASLQLGFACSGIGVLGLLFWVGLKRRPPRAAKPECA